MVMSNLLSTIVLPASGHIVPDSGFTVSAISQTETSRGVAFVAKLRYHGKLVGTFENTGNGGMDEVDLPFDLREPFGAACEQFLAMQDPADEDAMPALAYALMEEHDYARAFTRWSKRSIVFIVDPTAPFKGRIGKVPVANQSLRPDMIASLASQKPSAVVWSGGAFVPAAEAV